MISPASSSSTLGRATYVACNVYVSAGGDAGHRSILLDLLRKAQQATQTGRVGVVHAFADRVYNRSSFHLVGDVESVSVVAGGLVNDAVTNLRSFSQQAKGRDAAVDQPQEVHHPYVGFVDHVAIMPLEGTDTVVVDDNLGETFSPCTPSGSCARKIGSTLEESGVNVYYYGSAHPQGAPLANVRREKTQFFSSGGLSSLDDDQNVVEVATVGAPLTFVENYNIRLTASCPKSTAQSLTRLVRERDGGLPGVEALTLPYSNGRWEVACNLLQPRQASTGDIDDQIQKWQDGLGENFVEKAYRVGTTAEQCLKAISLYNDELWREHNDEVQNRMLGYLST